MTTSAKKNNGQQQQQQQMRRRSFTLSLLLVVVAFLALLAASPVVVEAKKKTAAPAPAPSPAALAEAARAKAAALESSSRAEAAAAAAASRALDDLPRRSGTKPFQLQFLGTHRSYRVAPPRAATAFLRSRDGAAALSAARGSDPNGPSLLAQILSPVTREPLAEQAEKGIRAFHLDAWADGGGSGGGGGSGSGENGATAPSSLYAAGWAGPKLGGASEGGDRRGRGDAASAASTAALMRSNPRAFKVFSDPDFDGLSVCATLSVCLADLKGWSDARPGHSPVVVFVEPRDEALFKGGDVARVVAAKEKKGKAGADGAAAAAAAVGGNGTTTAAAEFAEAAVAAAAAAPLSSATFDELLKELTLSPGPTSLARPPKIDAAALVALDEEIRAALGGKRGPAAPPNDTEAAAAAAAPSSSATLFAPEDLRAASNMSSGSLLARNVLARGGKGWPDADALRGRILVVVVGKHAALYAETMAKARRGAGAGGRQAAFAAAPSQDAAGPDTLVLDLAPRAIAVDQAGQPFAPAPARALARWEDAISTAARSAFLVRASADFAGAEAAAFSSSSSSSSSPSRAEAVLRSGATFVMTDYPPFAPDPVTGYSVALERGGGGEENSKRKAVVALRCNPATAPKNPASLSFAEVGCAAVPPPTPKKAEVPVAAAAAAAGGVGDAAAAAAPESPSPLPLPPANGDGPSPDDPYYGGDGTLIVASPAPAPAPSAAPLVKPLPVSVTAAASTSAVSPASGSKAAAVSTAARPKADAEVVSAAAGPVDAVAPAPKKKASWASPVDTTTVAAAAPLDADAADAAAPPALAADDEAAAATEAPVAATAAAPKPAAAAAPAPRRPGYATPAGAGAGEGRSSSSSSSGAAAAAASNGDDAPAVPRRRFLDPNAAPETGANGPSFIPLGPSRIEAGDSPDGSVVAPAAAAVPVAAAAPVVAASSAADGEVAPRARNSGGAKRAADNHARPRGFDEEEEANSHTGDAALAMPSLLP